MHSAQLQALLGLRWPPVAVTFCDVPPPGVPRVVRAAPAGCAYWRMAAEGAVFYTQAADHFGCLIGSHTHHADLPPEKAPELQAMVTAMAQLQYISVDEAASIPRLPAPLRIAVYAPLEKAPCDPGVVIVRGNGKQVMLAAEAARAAGIGHDGAALGRPACSMVPAALETSRGALSLACIGNRVYTGLSDDELYYVLPGAKLAGVIERLEVILHANRELEKFHQARLVP